MSAARSPPVCVSRLGEASGVRKRTNTLAPGVDPGMGARNPSIDDVADNIWRLRWAYAIASMKRVPGGARARSRITSQGGSSVSSRWGTGGRRVVT